MRRSQGFALISILLLAIVMFILVVSLLQSSQLSLRIADLGQQQLVSRHQAWAEHQLLLTDISTVPADPSPHWCPARFAAWEGHQLQCSRQLVWSETVSSPMFTERVGSIRVTMALDEELLND